MIIKNMFSKPIDRESKLDKMTMQILSKSLKNM